MPAGAGSTACREQMDCPGMFPVRILSLPTPAFDKIVPLSHSVTLICHFLRNNRMLVGARFAEEMLRRDQNESCPALRNNSMALLNAS